MHEGRRAKREARERGEKKKKKRVSEKSFEVVTITSAPRKKKMIPQGYFQQHQPLPPQRQAAAAASAAAIPPPSVPLPPSASAPSRYVGGGGGGVEYCSGRTSSTSGSTAAPVTLGHRTNPHYHAQATAAVAASSSGGVGAGAAVGHQQSSSSSSSSSPSSATQAQPYHALAIPGGGVVSGGTASSSASSSSAHGQSSRQDMTTTAAEAQALAQAYAEYFDHRQEYAPHPTFTNRPDQHEQQLQQQQHQQQQQQQQQHQQRHQYHHHHHQQQQQPEQHWFPAEYCTNQGFPQNFLGSTWMADRPTDPPSQFPDSPPDSGSEPYSPPNDNQVHPDQDGSSGKVVTMNGNGMPVYLYPNQNALMSSHPLSHPNIQAQSSLSPSNSHQPQQQQQLSGGMPHLLQAQTHSMPGMAALSLQRSNYSNPYGGAEPPKLNHPSPQMLMSQINPQINPQLNPQSIGLNVAATHPPKKRKYSDSPPGTLAPGLMVSLGLGGIFPVKPEPCPPDLHYGIPPDCSEDDSYSYDFGAESGMFLDGTYQVIKWTAHQTNKWATLLDETMKEIPGLNYRVDADKGFNYAPPDDAFVCQKKNHFQITVHLSVPGVARFVKPVDGNVTKVDSFFLHFYGIKMESPAQTIKVEQSQSDRSKKQFHPVKIEVPADQVTKVTVGRLHFSETTANNMRKKGKPNPDQRYFQLVVALQAHCSDEVHMIAAHASERIIVRVCNHASNPGQFESDVEASWSKGKTSESIYHAGRVGINTDNPDESLSVHGNIRLTGHVISPSDVRTKKNIVELDSREQLKNISQLKVYQYSFNEEFAEYAGLTDDEVNDTGVIAQDVSQILPDAVRETGDVVLPGGQKIDNFLVVNKERIFIENVGAVKELCKVTDKLENRITEIEIINKKLAKLSALRGSFKSICSSISLSACSLGSRSESKSLSSQNNTKVSSASKHHNRQRQQQQQQQPLRSCSADQHHQQPMPQAAAAPPGVCSSRAIQITVVVLVLIMALCLMSITILYIIDRQNYPQPEAPVMLVTAPVPGNWTQSMTTAKLPVGPDGQWLPGDSPEPLLPPECILQPHYCSIQCCSSPTQPPQYDPDHGFSQVVGTVSTSQPAKKADKSTKSPNDVNYEFESDVKMSHDLGGGHVSFQGLRTDHLLDAGTGSKVIRTLPVIMKIRPPATVSTAGVTLASTTDQAISTAHPFTTLDTTINDYTTGVSETTTSDVDESNVIGFLKQPVVIDDVERNSIANDIRSGRMDDYNPLDSKDVNMSDRVVELYFKQLNRTISTVYCTNGNCRQQSGGNYTYAVPLSARFPPLFITVTFKMLVSENALGISLCDEKEGTSCSQGEADIARQLINARKTGNLEWDLPIGYYTSTFFKFRVYPTNQPGSTADVCRQLSADVGNSFAEYHLSFYRVCS